MLELLSMLRPLGSWHFLLAVVVLDVTFILIHVSQYTTISPEDGLQNVQEKRLREVLALQLQVARSLKENGEALSELYHRAEVKPRTLEELEKGVTALEKQIQRLKQNLTVT